MSGGNQNRVHDEIVRRMRKKLEAVGCMTVHLKSYTARRIGRRIYRIPLMIEKGWPDIFCFTPSGQIVFYEVKTGDAVLNPEQRKRFADLTRMGFIVKIIRGPLMAQEVFKWKKKD